ncbi:c-type cytochrome [Futiania mangrovi]|uniref:Cytochrome c family protein n=1 Tax=Futiania mangrovi TaxID=2959716 RepID=A0A9J6PC67_9PROT|nr:cytochrome c family protein [Futiania mangrovii]MCP1336885.1 cytochrome c family protein [Futiania mangrovii]
MNSFEFNKIAGGVLLAALVTLGLGTLAEIVFHPDELEEQAYKVAGLESGGGEAAGAAEAAPEVSVIALLATGDIGAMASAGEGAARACAACHTFDNGGANRVGPNLWGIVGANIGHLDNFSYSSALQEKEGTWTYEALDGFLANPRGWAPGTKMSYAGMKKPEDRAEMIAYLRSLSDSPQPLPEAPAEAAQATPAESAPQQAAEAPAQAAAPAADIAALVASADAAAGEKSVRICSACHTFNEGGQNRVGPNLWGVVGAQVAHHEGYKYSDAMQSFGGEWTLERLADYLRHPRDTVPGTKMAFAGIKKDEELYNILAYLKTLGGK